MARKMKKMVFFVVPLGVIFMVILGFGVGHLLFSAKITGNKRYKLDIGVHGIRMIDPDEKRSDEDLKFNDVWEKGVSPKDIPSLPGEGRRNTSSGGADNRDENVEDVDEAIIDGNNESATGVIQEPTTNNTSTSPANPAYTDNSRKRNE